MPARLHQDMFRQDTGELALLFKFRNIIAHSKPDHGDRYRRLRRREGKNELVEVTAEQVTREIQRGKVCHSALQSFPIYLYGFDGRPAD